MRTESEVRETRPSSPTVKRRNLTCDDLTFEGSRRGNAEHELGLTGDDLAFEALSEGMPNTS